MRLHHTSIAVAAVVLCASTRVAVAAQVPGGTTLDEAVAPGNNFDKAEFRLWYPDNISRLQGAIILVPGSNGDGRAAVDDSVWRAFAMWNGLALVGCRFTDKPHEQGFIEEYVDVARGSGAALIQVLGTFAMRAKHPELAGAPLLLWGMSAGGEFNYEFVAWKPERVIAFVVNKGGIYYSALLPRAARDVPGILFVGGKDMETRTSTIVGLFAVNRRGGALWSLAEEPGAAHIVGRSRDMALIFFDDVLGLRLDPQAPTSLKAMPDKNGFIGDLKLKTFQPASTAGTPSIPNAWLPTARVARAWQALVTEAPFEP